MTNTMNVTIGFAAFLVLALFALILPMSAHAADYAYVNNAGFVALITADNSTTALLTANSISLHSGVCLLSKPSDYTMIGKYVRTVQQGY